MNLKIRAFTLIELLIVVAIIAILAAIAVPNFLEAQMRSKVARCAADIRSIRTALESYRVDNNKYPETDTGETNINNQGVGMFRLTTPVAFITSVPKSPFKEVNMGNPGSPKNANLLNIYLYVRAENSPGLTTDVAPQDGLDDNYNTDRAVYMGSNILSINLAVRSQGYWMMKSVGPNNVDDRNTLGNNARVYDATNGTVSEGDIVVFSDSSGFAQPRAN